VVLLNAKDAAVVALFQHLSQLLAVLVGGLTA
jgi:hypothetical protein